MVGNGRISYFLGWKRWAQNCLLVFQIPVVGLPKFFCFANCLIWLKAKKTEADFIHTFFNRQTEIRVGKWMKLSVWIHIFLQFALCISFHGDSWLGKDGATKSDDISEKFQTAFDSLLIFRKLCSDFFNNGYGWIYAGRYEGQMVWNPCTWFPEMGIILRGGVWGGQLQFGTFPKIHPFW